MGMFSEWFGGILEMFWPCIGDVLRLFSGCFGDVVGLFLDLFGHGPWAHFLGIECFMTFVSNPRSWAMFGYFVASVRYGFAFRFDLCHESVNEWLIDSFSVIAFYVSVSDCTLG